MTFALVVKSDYRGSQQQHNDCGCYVETIEWISMHFSIPARYCDQSFGFNQSKLAVYRVECIKPYFIEYQIVLCIWIHQQSNEIECAIMLQFSGIINIIVYPSIMPYLHDVYGNTCKDFLL